MVQKGMTAVTAKGKVADDLIQFAGPESPTIPSSLDITITRPQVKLAQLELSTAVT